MAETAREGTRYSRILDSGMEVCVYARMFNSLLTFGPAGQPFYDVDWCYETPGAAIAAADEWDGNWPTTEPDGWFRNKLTARRRPNGDPEKEYIAS